MQKHKTQTQELDLHAEILVYQEKLTIDAAKHILHVVLGIDTDSIVRTAITPTPPLSKCPSPQQHEIVIKFWNTEGTIPKENIVHFFFYFDPDNQIVLASHAVENDTLIINLPPPKQAAIEKLQDLVARGLVVPCEVEEAFEDELEDGLNLEYEE